jgi:ubiquinone/menaquinone biosynthesis C-methylase UbiE
VATSFDYRRQAATYDSTRAASPSVLGPLRVALGDPGDAVLLDVGGGTGNYARALADEGWSAVVVDRSAEMLASAAAKGIAVALGDAALLPVPDGSAGAVILVSMLHHVPDWPVALVAARRAARPGGAVVLMTFTREHLDVHWVERYFPTALVHFRAVHQTFAELRAALPGARELPVRYDDVVDGSLAALCRQPHLLLDPQVRRQTSFFEWVGEHVPDELDEGLRRLADDIDAGRRPQDDVAGLRDRIGDATVFAWRRPG